MTGGRTAAALVLVVLFGADASMAGPEPQGQASRGAPLADAAEALSSGDLDRARTMAATSLQTHPKDAAACVLLARVEMAQDDYDTAYLHLRQAMALAPGDEDVLYYLGLVTSHLARQAFAQLFAMAPDSARVHQLMAESFEAQDLRSEAEREYEAALAADPTLLDAMLGLAKLRRIRLDCDRAIDLYTRAERIRPTFEGAYGLGVCHLTKQNDGVALTHLERAVERNPRAAIAWVDLASAMLRVGRTEQAIATLEKALALEPRMGDAHYMLGRAYQAAGDTARARDAFATAKTLGLGQPRQPGPR